MRPSATVPEGVLRRVAELSRLATIDPASARAALARIPVEVLDAMLDEERMGDWEPDDRATLLEVLALDEREYVRVPVAAQLGAFDEPLPDSVEPTLERLCEDETPSVRDTAASSLTTLLERSGGLGRAAVVVSWASSPEPACRCAIAQALSTPLHAVGVASAIEALAGDSDPDVRAAAAIAAHAHAEDAPGVCSEVLRRLAHDPDPRVRLAARGG